MRGRTFKFAHEELRIVAELKDVSTSDIMFGVILYYPCERISENALVEFFLHLRDVAPIPFAERRFRDVRGILEGMGCCTVWSNVFNGDPDGWRKHRVLVDEGAKSLVERAVLPKHEGSFRLLAAEFRAQAFYQATEFDIV